MNILVVDDNPEIAMLAKIVLELDRHDVIIADSGEDAIHKVQIYAFDLIFMDIMMPRLTGIQTLEILKANPNFITPVIAFTAKALTGEREQLLTQGFQDYLAKPFDIADLRAMVVKHTAKGIKITPPQTQAQTQTKSPTPSQNPNP